MTSGGLKKDTFVVDVAMLKPTQFDAGMAVVRELRKKIKALAREGPSVLDEYLQQWVVPVVIGPKNHMYMIDRHSECAAMYWSELGQRNVYVRMVANWSHFDDPDFWQQMVEKEMCYLKRQGKTKFLASELPGSIADMPDDPYRSLAWACRVNNPPGFKKLKVSFTEFTWSDYLREHEVQLNEHSGGKWLEFLSKNKKKRSKRTALCRSRRRLEGCSRPLQIAKGINAPWIYW